LSRTPIVSTIKGQIPVSNMSKAPTVSIIKDQIPVSDLSRTPNSKYNKGPDTSQ
jgi:hypothetical protein